MEAMQGSDRLIKLDRRSPVRMVGLGAILCAAAVLWRILWPLRWNLVALWLAVEVFFYVFYWRPRYAELNAQPRQHRPTRHDAMAAFERCLQYFRDTTGIDYEMYYSGWFMGAKLADIKRGNAEEFLAYAFWYRTMQEMRDEGLGDVPRQMLDKLESVWGLILQPGYTPGLRFMGHLWEPLKAQWRPLAFYLTTWAAGWFARLLLRRWGFQMHRHQGLAYFTLNMRSPSSQPARKLGSGGSSSDESTATSTAAPSTPRGAAPTPRSPPAAVAKSPSAPSLTAYRARAASSPSVTGRAQLAALRSKSSPFEASSLNWAAQMAADAENLTASITAASAVHSPAQPVPPLVLPQPARPGGPRRGGSALRRRAGPPPAASAAACGSPGLTPWLSTHTSMMLQALPNPLEDALSDGLGSKDMPILFLHGVGGLAGYLEMLLQVMALGHPVVVLEMNTVAMRLASVTDADHVVQTIIGVLDKLGIEQACVIGHSYGTFVAGRLARLHSNRVRSLCLIDPVCFGMFMPQLLSNFLYTVPKWRGLHHVVDFVKKAGVYMASHELHVCATFSRSFFWTDLNLWPEDLAPGSVVLLSGRDDLMNARQVKTMLDRPGHIKVHYNHELTHGEFLIKSEVKQAIMEEMRRMLARSGSAVVGLARPVLARTMTLARGALNVGSVVSLHKAHGGGKYVEDHTNKLVRTFTGNLTAMLQQVNSVRPTFDAAGSRGASAGGAPPRSRLGRSAAAAAAAAVSPASSSGSTTGGAAAAAGAAAATTTAAGEAQQGSTAGLAQALSVPMPRRKSAHEHWSKRIEEIQEQASATAEASAGSSSDGCSDAGSDACSSSSCTSTSTASAGAEPQQPAQPQAQPALKGALALRAASRRSSGSGGRVLILSDGVEVASSCSSTPVARAGDKRASEECASV